MDAVQQLLFKTNKFPYSPYLTKEYTLSLTGMSKGQEMQLHIDVNATEGTPDLKPRVDNQTLKYGPIAEDIQAFTLLPMGLLYDHNRPVTKAVNLNRSIWLPASDVNKVSIEEYYELTHVGAALDSGFSRIDWMKGRYEGTRNHWALSHLELPLLDRDLDGYYYTDKVGVVSSHKVIKTIYYYCQDIHYLVDGIIISLLVGLKIYQDFFINYMIPLMNILSNSPF